MQIVMVLPLSMHSIKVNLSTEPYSFIRLFQDIVTHGGISSRPLINLWLIRIGASGCQLTTHIVENVLVPPTLKNHWYRNVEKCAGIPAFAWPAKPYKYHRDVYDATEYAFK